MSHGLKLTRVNPGNIRTIQDAGKALIDITSQLNVIINLLNTPDSNPAAGEIKAFIREDDGSYHLYSLVAGAGMTITPDTVNKTLTFTSP